MWVDQPAAVGFSTGFGTHNEDGVASNMLFFLQGFFTRFPQYAKTKFYIFGESYGGHYVPAISHKIWESNKANEGVKIPLAGLAIGNGLTDPEEQYKWYPKMGHDGGKDEGGHAPGVFNNVVYGAMELATPACIASIKACNSGNFNLTTCLASSEGCNLVSQIPYRATGKNPYDQRIKCEHGNLCYDFDHIGTYLNTKAVQEELGVKKNWGSCNYAVNMLFQYAGDWMHGNYALKLPELLHDGIEVLIYAGDCDYICNWLGNKAWTKVLEWDGKDDFNKASDHDWQVSGKTVARLRKARSFHFMQVFEAGHMVPMDQPAVALAMVNAFIGGAMSDHVVGSDIVV
jgi:cathepsin A (carboxypeptidase C)